MTYSINGLMTKSVRSATDPMRRRRNDCPRFMSANHAADV